MKKLIVSSFLIPLFLPLRYSLSMLILGIILSIFLIYYCIKRRAVFHIIQKNTDIDLSNFIKIKYFLTDAEKYIISAKQLPSFNAENAKNILKKNHDLFLSISPYFAKKFFDYSGKVFILKLWLFLTVFFMIIFMSIGFIQ